jgi:hypothetical protein
MEGDFIFIKKCSIKLSSEFWSLVQIFYTHVYNFLFANEGPLVHMRVLPGKEKSKLHVMVA